MAIEVNLRKWGNSQGFLIPRSILDLLGWDMDVKLCLNAKNNRLIIKKQKRQKVSNIQKLFKNFSGSYKKEAGIWEGTGL